MFFFLFLATSHSNTTSSVFTKSCKQSMMSMTLRHVTCRLCCTPIRPLSTTSPVNILVSSLKSEKDYEPIDPATGVEEFPSDAEENYRKRLKARDQTKLAFRPEVCAFTTAAYCGFYFSAVKGFSCGPSYTDTTCY